MGKRQNLSGLGSRAYLRGAEGKDEYDKKYTVRNNNNDSSRNSFSNNRDKKRWGKKQMLKQPKSEMYQLLKPHT